MTNQAALLELAEVEGYDDTFDLLEASITDSVCPAICVECGYTCEMEPDQDRGWCEECQKNTVKSALVLGGIY